jgi:hypothetical protein
VIFRRFHDQSEDLAAADGQAYIVERLHAREGLTDVLHS